MITFSDWTDLPPEVRTYLDRLEDFISALDGQETDDGTIDVGDAVKPINGLVSVIDQQRGETERQRREVAEIKVEAAELAADLRRALAEIKRLQPGNLGAENERLRADVLGMQRMLWIMTASAGGKFAISKHSLERYPGGDRARLIRYEDDGGNIWLTSGVDEQSAPGG